MKLISTAVAALSCVAVVGCGAGGNQTFTEARAKIYCSDLIKQQLRDPDSYRVNDVVVVSTYGDNNQYGKASIDFRSKNGFGGYVNGNATCTAYNKDGDLWHRARVN